MSKTERNYDAHKLKFLALKWAVTERFHEYLYGGRFEVYTDNNPLTYILTTAKLDATRQWWVASLATYDFKIFYKAGKLNVDVDSLRRIPWEHSQVSDTPLDTILTKNTLLSPQLTEKIPHLPHAVIQSHELFVCSELELSKSQWKCEQDFDHAIQIFVQLLKSGNLSSYQIQKTDHDDLKCMLRL